MDMVSNCCMLQQRAIFSHLSPTKQDLDYDCHKPQSDLALLIWECRSLTKWEEVPDLLAKQYGNELFNTLNKYESVWNGKPDGTKMHVI